METVAVVGLGYVGLPLAVAFGHELPTIGFDLDENKLALYRQGCDPGGEVNQARLASATQLDFTTDAKSLAAADVIVVVVPTPIDEAHQPDLKPLAAACRTVAEHMQPGTTVVFESTVYPGCTEEFCVPILESVSGLRWLGAVDDSGVAGETNSDAGFYVGYSPERINPGDREHRLDTVVKVVAGDTPETLARLTALYERVVHAGVHQANSLKVAEAAKVIENTQRDLNIALMNELALIFHRLGIDTADVLAAAATKWNFLPFQPGLVGGHCIGVDPYYLTHKAEAAGHHPQVILAGRQTNDSMGKYIAEQTVKCLVKKGLSVHDSEVVILGLTFKEDCPDLRNSHVVDIINELMEYRCRLSVHDPVADAQAAQNEYGVRLVEWDALPRARVVILAVPHEAYRKLRVSDIKSIMQENALLVDVKSVVCREELALQSVDYWRL